MDLEDLLNSQSESGESVTDSDSAESDFDEDLIQDGYNALNLLDSLDAMDEEPTIMLEAVASYDMLIWHVFFGPAGSNNDINVLNESDLFEDLLDGRALEVRYTINGHKFTKGYYLVDDIYPKWATLVKSFKCSIEPKNLKFKSFQEAARKDVERAFGVLQGRWAILKYPTRPFSINKIRRIMYTCVILHNMITEDNVRNICGLEEDYLRNRENMTRRTWAERVQLQDWVVREMRDRRAHHILRNSLIEHI
ncbi:uncharacterized protein [Rutidosis leptorrhynchoides]|uniref:uncharacterized protein n=1 Tax=Rutidosis leptorrhynchoides TaxID=125765 RepID=UPI003A993ED8